MNNKNNLISRRSFLKGLVAGAASMYGINSLCSKLIFPVKENSSLLKEAMFYETLANQKVKCKLCPRGCIILDKSRGYCRVRENKNGKLFSLVYGMACTKNNDPIEKKPFFHFKPGTKAFSIATVGCNFACLFCQNWDISQASPEDLSVEFVSPEKIAEEAKAP